MNVIVVVLLAVVALAAVVLVVHLEQNDTVRGVAGGEPPSAATVSPRWSAALREVDSVEELAAVSFPRARMGYDPLAVRAVLVEMATAYRDLAAASDAETVARAWDRSRHRTARGSDPEATVVVAADSGDGDTKDADGPDGKSNGLPAPGTDRDPATPDSTDPANGPTEADVNTREETRRGS